MQTANMRADARRILDAALAAVDPRQAVRKALTVTGGRLQVAGQVFELDDYARVVVVGAGKASAAMAAAVEELLGARVSTGLVVTKYGHGVALERVELREAGHPVPDAAGLAAARDMRALLEGCGERDLVIALISGGGSALLPLPIDGLTLADKQAITTALLKSGADIQELNTVRKQLSQVKGGGLAAAAHPATVINLMISDVIGDCAELIAAGPFAPDSTNASQALAILRRHGQADSPAAASLTRRAAEARPDASAAIFAKVFSRIIASNRAACLAARQRASELGYNALLLSSSIAGDTAAAAHLHAAIARELLSSGNPLPPPACIVSGGETTVRVTGGGLGGRNQEFALVCASAIEELSGPVVILSAGTDGTDGPTDAAGGLVDNATLARGRSQGLSAAASLADNDSYHFLRATGDLLMTGPTRTNVMDIRVVLVAQD